MSAVALAAIREIVLGGRLDQPADLTASSGGLRRFGCLLRRSRLAAVRGGVGGERVVPGFLFGQQLQEHLPLGIRGAGIGKPPPEDDQVFAVDELFHGVFPQAGGSTTLSVTDSSRRWSGDVAILRRYVSEARHKSLGVAAFPRRFLLASTRDFAGATK
jgi:hypothetical protein